MVCYHLRDHYSIKASTVVYSHRSRRTKTQDHRYRVLLKHTHHYRITSRRRQCSWISCPFETRTNVHNESESLRESPCTHGGVHVPEARGGICEARAKRQRVVVRTVRRGHGRDTMRHTTAIMAIQRHRSEYKQIRKDTKTFRDCSATFYALKSNRPG